MYGQDAAQDAAQGQACRVSEIPDQMSLLSERTKHLHGMVDNLESRLSPVLRPVGPPQPTSNAIGLETPKSTPHGSELAALHRQIGEAKNRLEDILSRLEV